jgi:hypothetical protein
MIIIHKLKKGKITGALDKWMSSYEKQYSKS